jgi:hypothetical protein
MLEIFPAAADPGILSISNLQFLSPIILAYIAILRTSPILLHEPRYMMITDIPLGTG